MPTPTLHERSLGCLLGGAVGDALGAPVEFLKRAEIEARFGPEGVQGYVPAYGGLGRITDDTQMALFTAEGLLRAHLRGLSKGIVSHTGVVAHAYLRWWATQQAPGNPPHPAAPDGGRSGWLVQQRELHARRAPGNTCLSALAATTRLGEPARNDSKGCGGVMRVAPVALYAHHLGGEEALRQGFAWGCELSALTHGHPSGILPGGALVHLLGAMLQGQSLEAATEGALRTLEACPDQDESSRALRLARQLAEAGTPPAEAMPRLGLGWVAEEALALGLYAAWVAPDFATGLRWAVHHDGDSDSTGAIAGHLMGARWGAQAIPEGWLAGLELRACVAAIAEDQLACPSWGSVVAEGGPAAEALFERYPPF